MFIKLVNDSNLAIISSDLKIVLHFLFEYTQDLFYSIIEPLWYAKKISQKLQYKSVNYLMETFFNTEIRPNKIVSGKSSIGASFWDKIILLSTKIAQISFSANCICIKAVFYYKFNMQIHAMQEITIKSCR